MQTQQNHTQTLEKPLVSFILTYYNLPVKMLCECIDSILALSLRPDEREIIIVDDGSANSIVDSLARYEKDILYVRQANQGLSGARNTGIRMAKGDYLQFVDGDDLLVKAPYEHCLDLIRKNQPEMVVFDFTKTKAEKQNWQDAPPQSGSHYMRHNNIKGTACGFLFRRSILGDLRFTPGIYHEDEEFTPQLLIRAEVVYATPFKAYYYRKHQASVIQQKDGSSKERRLDDNLQVIRHLHYLADRMPNNDRLALNRRVAQLTMDYLYNTIMLHQSLSTLNAAIDTLRQDGLFPLPDRDYTAKYTWFRRLSNSSIGRILLLHSLPLLKKER
jgi:glycosyltransferase involved in cell wall biosynthesis